LTGKKHEKPHQALSKEGKKEAPIRLKGEKKIRTRLGGVNYTETIRGLGKKKKKKERNNLIRAMRRRKKEKKG